jgi:hypothetical protein
VSYLAFTSSTLVFPSEIIATLIELLLESTDCLSLRFYSLLSPTNFLISDLPLLWPILIIAFGVLADASMGDLSLSLLVLEILIVSRGPLLPL